MLMRLEIQTKKQTSEPPRLFRKRKEFLQSKHIQDKISKFHEELLALTEGIK